jgi:hypothetical protein
LADLETLLDRLIRARFQFVVVGGVAVVAHGTSWTTRDLDLCCPFTKENLERLLRALEGLRPRHRTDPSLRPLTEDAAALASFKNLYLETDEGPLDCLGAISGVGDFDEVLRQSIEVPHPAGPCQVISLDALIRAKEAMNLPRDREVLRLLYAIRERRRPV